MVKYQNIDFSSEKADTEVALGPERKSELTLRGEDDI